MKKLILLTALGVAFGGGASAQTVLTPHFTETSRKIVVPEWSVVQPEIREGMISISHGGTLYVSASTGEYVWGSTSPVGMVGNIASPYFSGGASMGVNSSPYGRQYFIAYPDGTFRTLPREYLRASQFCEGYALVRKGNLMESRQLFIDKNGREVFPALTSVVQGDMGDLTVHPLREGRRVFFNAETEKYGYADEAGRIVIQARFDDALDFSEGLAAVMVVEGFDRLWGFIDTTGKLVIPHTYKSAPGRFSEGLAVVRHGVIDGEPHPMTLIDKTGREAMEPQLWGINEFHDGFAWVATGCDKLFIMDRDFKEVKDMTEYFYQNGNGFGVCNFNMFTGPATDQVWGIDFPGGMQALNQDGEEPGDIFTPDGQLLFSGASPEGDRILLHAPTEGGLMYCEVRLTDASRLPEENMSISCFINTGGEIVYYFVPAEAGFEGGTPREL